MQGTVGLAWSSGVHVAARIAYYLLAVREQGVGGGNNIWIFVKRRHMQPLKVMSVHLKMLPAIPADILITTFHP